MESRIKGRAGVRVYQGFFESLSDVPGRGGSHYWEFQTAQVGLGAIELSYHRLWEKEKAPARTFTLRVHVLK
ncbi:MAG: hypothetical protein C4291_13560 [Candidatus Dadabacteria bacterium]